MNQAVDDTRYTRGLAKLTELGGDADEEIAPMGDLGPYIVRQKLDRDSTTQLRILCQIHLTHSAFTEQ